MLSSLKKLMVKYKVLQTQMGACFREYIKQKYSQKISPNGTERIGITKDLAICQRKG